MKAAELAAKSAKCVEAKEAKHKEIAAMEAQYKSSLAKNAVEVAEKAKEFEKQPARLAAQKTRATPVRRRATPCDAPALALHKISFFTPIITT